MGRSALKHDDTYIRTTLMNQIVQMTHTMRLRMNMTLILNLVLMKVTFDSCQLFHVMYGLDDDIDDVGDDEEEDKF